MDEAEDTTSDCDDESDLDEDDLFHDVRAAHIQASRDPYAFRSSQVTAQALSELLGGYAHASS